MPWKWNMIFSGIFENIWHWERSRRGKHLATRVEGVPYPPGRAPCLMGPRWLPSTYSCTHTLLIPPKKSPSISSTSSSSFCYDFRSPCSKHLSQNCFGWFFLGMWLPEPTPEPIPKPTPKKRGVLFLSPKICKRQRNLWKKRVLKLKMLRIYHLLKTHVVKVNSLYRFDEGDIPHYKSTSQCLDEFDNFIVKQEDFIFW